LLESSEVDAEGRLRRVEFTWKMAGNPIHRGWQDTVLGTIEIDGNRIFGAVNSAERAARLRDIVEARCPQARHLGTDVETLEEAMARQSAEGEPPKSAEAESLVRNPEVQDQIRAIMAKHYEDWVHQAIPALGGLSPMEAVREKAGREKVEALVAQIERRGRSMSPPLDEAIIRRLRERLGLGGEELPPSTPSTSSAHGHR
jgi:hypothetical protein